MAEVVKGASRGMGWYKGREGFGRIKKFFYDGSDTPPYIVQNRPPFFIRHVIVE